MCIYMHARLLHAVSYHTDGGLVAKYYVDRRPLFPSTFPFVVKVMNIVNHECRSHQTAASGAMQHVVSA